MKKHTSPSQQKSSRLWLWGLHTCKAALQNPQRKCVRLLMTDGASKELGILKEDLPCNPERLEGSTLARLLPLGAVHQGIAMEVVPLPDPFLQEAYKAETGVLIVLDQVTDPHNVGAILRTAKALGALGVMMTDHNAPPLSGVLAKTASGALDLLPVWKVTNLARALEDLKVAGFWIVGLSESASQVLSKDALPAKLALIMGAEGKGMRQLTQEKCDFLVKLPTDPTFSTLNVSVATALALYELRAPFAT